MRRLSQLGFDVPRWLAGNDERSASAFLATCEHGAVYKACSGLRSRVRRLDDAAVARLRDGTTPVVIQEYIPGWDVRVHVVGSRVFGTEVRSSGTDYRFESEGAVFQPTAIPDGIGERCIEVAGVEGLIIAGFDFRATEDGRWYCLEVNPVPTFLPYEMSTGQPIGDALVDVLTLA